MFTLFGPWPKVCFEFFRPAGLNLTRHIPPVVGSLGKGCRAASEWSQHPTEKIFEVMYAASKPVLDIRGIQFSRGTIRCSIWCTY